MRAAVVREAGPKAEVRDDVVLLGPDAGQVKVKIHSTGVCHSDISAMDGTLPQPLPCVLGHEGAGEVIEIGDGVDNVEVGDRVVAVWIPPCRECRTCLRGQPNLCQQKTMSAMGSPRFQVDGEAYWGYAGTGTFSEETVLAKEALVKLPEDVPYEIGALVGCGVTTGAGAVFNTSPIEPGSSVAVIGAGGVGISTIQAAQIMGAAEIVAIDMVDKKLEWARGFGATHGVQPDLAEEIKNELTGGDGFDYVFEVVGRSSTIRQAYDLTRRGGTCVVVGAGSLEDMVSFSCFELFYNEKKLLGSVYGSADVALEFPRLWNLWRTGRLDLDGMISQRLTLDDVNDAFDTMRAGEVIRQVINF